MCWPCKLTTEILFNTTIHSKMLFSHRINNGIGFGGGALIIFIFVLGLSAIGNDILTINRRLLQRHIPMVTLCCVDSEALCISNKLNRCQNDRLWSIAFATTIVFSRNDWQQQRFFVYHNSSCSFSGLSAVYFFYAVKSFVKITFRKKKTRLSVSYTVASPDHPGQTERYVFSEETESVWKQRWLVDFVWTENTFL